MSSVPESATNVTGRKHYCPARCFNALQVRGMQGHTQGGGARGSSPNGCMIVHNNNNIIVSGEVIVSAENSRKPLDGRGSAPKPAGEVTAPPDPLAGGEWVVAPPQEPPPQALGLGPFSLAPLKNPGLATWYGSMVLKGDETISELTATFYMTD